MRKMHAFVFFSVILLAGCSLSRRELASSAAFYDFGPPVTTVRSAAGVRPPLLLEVRMPPWLASSPAIHYRLLYHDRLRLSEYASSRWAAPPGVLVRQRLSQRLGVPLLPSSVPACRLFVEVREFVQVFRKPRQSSAMIEAQATLLDRNGRLLASRPIQFEVPAVTPDAAGGVAGLVSGVDQLAAEISDWLQARRKSRQDGCDVPDERTIGQR